MIPAPQPEVVELKTNTWKLLLGGYDRLYLEGEDMQIGNLSIAEYTLEANSGKIDIIQSLRARRPVMDAHGVADLHMQVIPEKMARLLDLQYGSLSDVVVEYYQGYIKVLGISDTPRGKHLAVAFDAELGSTDWSSLSVNVLEVRERVADGKPQLNAEELEELRGIYSISIPFDQTDPPMYIYEVEVTPDKLTINANMLLK